MMQEDIFTAGVGPGGPGSQTEVKTLLCYILSNIQQPMSFMELYEALSECNLVNYFELVRDVEQLCRTGHVERLENTPDGADRYRATPLGRSAGGELGTALPLTVREKASRSAQRVLRRQRRQSEVDIQVTPAGDGGYMMAFSIPDSGSDLIRLCVYSPTEEECDLMRKRFLNAPLFIYQQVLALLTGNPTVLGEGTFADEELF